MLSNLQYAVVTVIMKFPKASAHESGVVSVRHKSFLICAVTQSYISSALAADKPARLNRSYVLLCGSNKSCRCSLDF